MLNSGAYHGRSPKELTEEQVAEERVRLAKRGLDVSSASDDDIRLVHAPCNTELEQGFWCRTCATTFGPNAVRGVPKAGRRSRARKNP